MKPVSHKYMWYLLKVNSYTIDITVHISCNSIKTYSGLILQLYDILQNKIISWPNLPFRVFIKDNFLNKTIMTLYFILLFQLMLKCSFSHIYIVKNKNLNHNWALLKAGLLKAILFN